MARRILLADDSVTAQNMGRRILHDAGYEIVTVNNGSAALKKVAEQKPDLIILDVYMPGYGGLEVCSRLKENRETQRIPVLLTVGKLEPFKPEEARRVKADAYIVKPFEASELLSALTKLEDKIVPGPEPYKPGRFAKALASVEQTDGEKDFGDKETGWKERLVIPGKKGKKAQPEPEPEGLPAKSPHVVERGEDFRPAEKAGFERPIPGGLPQDISVEEIAAIAAAAAKISGKAAEESAAATVQEEKSAETKSAAAESTKAEEAVATPSVESTAAPASAEAAQPIAETAQEEAPATFASAPEAQETASGPEAAADAPVAQGAETAREAEPRTPEVPEPESHPASDAEVLAALAALTPANGDFSAHPAEVASATGQGSYSGPRWVAEVVALSEEESTFLLQHEMEKAHAAFAAAEAGRILLAQPVEAATPSNGTGHVSSDPGAAEAGRSAESETRPTEAVAAAVQATTEIVPEAVSPADKPAAEAALAAAASAGSTESAMHETQAIASTSPIPPIEEGSGMGEVELAAAWANWRNIRESIVGTQPSTDVPLEEKSADALPPAASEEIQKEEPKAEATPAEEKSEAPAATEAAELSSIVDNMLAELKPKLMEELKRKLGK